MIHIKDQYYKVNMDGIDFFIDMNKKCINATRYIQNYKRTMNFNNWKGNKSSQPLMEKYKDMIYSIKNQPAEFRELCGSYVPFEILQELRLWMRVQQPLDHLEEVLNTEVVNHET